MTTCFFIHTLVLHESSFHSQIKLWNPPPPKKNKEAYFSEAPSVWILMLLDLILPACPSCHQNLWPENSVTLVWIRRPSPRTRGGVSFSQIAWAEQGWHEYPTKIRVSTKRKGNGCWGVTLLSIHYRACCLQKASGVLAFKQLLQKTTPESSDPVFARSPHQVGWLKSTGGLWGISSVLTQWVW